MSVINGEMWAWIKTAPLPVVLAMGIVVTGVLGLGLHHVHADVENQKTKVEVAVIKAEDAKKIAESASTKLDKANDKLDKLLEAVLIIQAEAKAKKEKK